MKKILIAALSSLALISFASQEKIKVYAFYTPSHRVFVDNWFLPTMQDSYEVILEFHEQECEKARYMSPGWIDTMQKKVDIIIRGIQENWGKIFIHSDVDIQFFRPTLPFILNGMETHDMIVQRNRPDGEICAGFFACRGNEKTLNLWQQIKRRLTDKKYLKAHEGTHDQHELNNLIRFSNPYNISWDYLPIEFLGAGTVAGLGLRAGKWVLLPKEIILHHANFTQGIENKLAQLAYIRQLFNEQQSETNESIEQ